MAPVVFEIPEDLAKALSVNTKAIYKAKLNRLARLGFKDRESLLTKQNEVCKAIDDIAGEENTVGSRQVKRLFLSAVFWILHSYPLEQKKVYYEAFQKAKDDYRKPEEKVEDDWKDIDGCPNYQVSRAGEVRRVWKHKTRMLKQSSLSVLGYKSVAISISGKSSNKPVARLVATAFVPNPHGLAEVDHINHDPSDNRAENLRWASRADQMKNRRPYAASGLKHVYQQQTGRWVFAVSSEGKNVIQKSYKTKEEAIAARDAYFNK